MIVTASEVDVLSQEATSRFADLPTMRVHYHDAGSGPALLMLHGGGPGASGWSNFKQNLRALTPHFRTLLVDQPGFGRTDKPVHDLPQHGLTAQVLVELLDHLGIDQATPVGNSMGGAASLELTLSHPNRVDKLVLMAPAGGSLPVTSAISAETKLLRTFYTAPPGPSLERTRELIHAMVFHGDRVDPQTLQERFEAAMDPEPSAYNARMFKNWAAGGAPRQWTRLAEITHPTLLLWGREDKILPLDSSLHMLHQMPNAQLHVFPNCGHWCQVEAADAFERQIIDFLQPAE